MSKRELSPGDTFQNYKIVRVIGQGGMGRVYEAEHQFLRRRTALKVMLSERVGPEMRARMIQEARSLAELKHPNIVLVYDAGILADEVWIAMEYLEGRTLRSLRVADGPFSVGRALDVSIEICDGVAAAHDIHIVHRDLKPENVVITEQNQTKVLDFGAAKVLRRGEGMSTLADPSGKKRVIGTPEYMSPEHLRGDRVDDRTDTYALCCMAYELLARHPFSNPDGTMPEIYELAHRHFTAVPPPLASLAAQVPPEMAAIVQRGLAKDAAERPSVAELAAAFRTARTRTRKSEAEEERVPFAKEWTGPGSWAAHGPAVSLPLQVTPPSDPSRRVVVPSSLIENDRPQAATVSLRAAVPPPAASAEPAAATPLPVPAAPASPRGVLGDAPRSHAAPVYAKTQALIVPALDETAPPPAPALPPPQAITVMPETTGRDPRAAPAGRARAQRRAAFVVLAFAGMAGAAAALWLAQRSFADSPATVVPPLGDAAAGQEAQDDAGGDAGSGVLQEMTDSGAAEAGATEPEPAPSTRTPSTKPTASAKAPAAAKPGSGGGTKSPGGDLPFGPRPIPAGQ